MLCSRTEGKGSQQCGQGVGLGTEKETFGPRLEGFLEPSSLARRPFEEGTSR